MDNETFFVPPNYAVTPEALRPSDTCSTEASSQVLSLNWQLTRSGALNTWYRYETRDSDFDGYAYDNNGAYVGVTYGSSR